MGKDFQLSRREEKLIEELTLLIAEVDARTLDKAFKDSLFRGLASYVEGIKVGLNYQKNFDSV